MTVFWLMFGGTLIALIGVVTGAAIRAVVIIDKQREKDLQCFSYS